MSYAQVFKTEKEKKKGQNMTSIKTHFHDCEATIKALTTARNVLSSVWTP